MYAIHEQKARLQVLIDIGFSFLPLDENTSYVLYDMCQPNEDKMNRPEMVDDLAWFFTHAYICDLNEKQTLPQKIVQVTKKILCYSS